MREVTRLFTARTAFGAAVLVAAIDAGCFPGADRRTLVLRNEADTPETTPAIDAMPGFERWRRRFDRVVSWNDIIRPFHPSRWAPRPDDVPMWERQFRLLWGLGDSQVEVVTDSPTHPLAQIFTDAPVDVYAEGLTSYGPTAQKLDSLTGTRVRRLLHLDLLPGLEPLLLTEFGARPEIVPDKPFRQALGELAPYAPAIDAESGAAVLVGEAQDELLRAARELDAATPTVAAQSVLPELPEALYERLRPSVVIGCSPTALLTARTLYGLSAVRVGTEQRLGRLGSYGSSARIPLTVADALLPGVGEPTLCEEPAQLGALLKAVAFCMQPKAYPELRADAERYLSARLDERTRRYFSQRRLASLGLPGGLPSRLSFLAHNPTIRRTVRRTG